MLAPRAGCHAVPSLYSIETNHPFGPARHRVGDIASVIDSTSLDPDRLAPDAADPAVSTVMRDEVVFCLPSTPIDAVAKLMADNDLTEIPVLIDRRPVGYVRSTEILERLVLGDVVVTGSDQVRMPTTDVQAKEVLQTPLLLVDESQRLSEAVSLMRTHRRATALVMHEDDSPVGMLTAREVAAHAAAQLAMARIANG